MDYLQLAGKNVLVMGVANRKSVAYHIARLLADCGSNVVLCVRSADRATQVEKLFPDCPILQCDVEKQAEIDQLGQAIASRFSPLHGLVHSIAFADYAGGFKPFHETPRDAFLQAVNVSCFSLIAICNALRSSLERTASVVTISISTTRMAAENYGFMAPVKAALDSSLCFLAKSFAAFSEVRFNAVCPSLLKTSASAGIPGYVDSFLFAERVIPRGRAVSTEEVANATAFLLSPRSSAINAHSLVCDAGMAINYFDRKIVRAAIDPSTP